MIEIEIDGIYCHKCNDMHPTLKWHIKYDRYLNEEEWKERYLRGLQRFSIKCSPEQACQQYIKYLDTKEVVYVSTTDQCKVCGVRTNFICKKTGVRVCSDRCRYLNEEKVPL